ncbi:hypothetical protein FHS43_002893 [Streptosporangium becharense]|uniref:DUF4082 domain-containing protein n=1 Tax=Streptosporangium becharense TaxID=1816182 RepID=A0A7W9IKV8_9ACTN|nr:DUF4082 domain-containing protein [Streptosporangium becharense]MBB2911620.1 hypothetical protein [Streptosporangium becharense]MBB5822562.1 hypothetical protein [Streptosporangium becharense]
MHRPVRDALDRAAGTAAPTTDAGRSRSLPLSRRLPSRPRRAGRAWLRVSMTAVLMAGALAGTAGTTGTAYAVDPVDLGDAASFAVLAGTSVTNVNSTTVTGNLGVSPGASVSGFPPGIVSGGGIHAGNATAAAAKADAVAAYDDAAGRTPTGNIAAQLGGTTRGPGVYTSVNGTFSINGTLRLDAQGDPDAVFIFQASSLNVANVGNISLLRGAQADNLFWQIDGSATLGTYATFRGNLLADDSVSVGFGATAAGRLMALDGTLSIQGTNSIPATRLHLPDDPPTTTTLTSSTNPAWRGDPVTLTATVQPVTGSLVPAGEVVFKDGSTVLGSALHNASGPARITIDDLGPGPHQLTAVYLGGDTFDHEAVIHFAPSTSPPVEQNMSDSLWDKAATPAVASQPDAQAITVGVKFRATTSGTVTAVRFYKGTQNTGTHTGSLWTSTGQLLANAVFTDETASGWQQVNFSTPVAIAAGTTYVASYHTTSGYYSTTRPYFTAQRTNGPLVAPTSAASGGNGVYTYGATNSFPSTSYQTTNYWVDVVFTPTNSLWDEVAVPAIVSYPDDQPITVGVKFRTTVNGKVSGIRFYKGPQNTGQHVATLWASNGQLLAEADFTNETASGWQQVNFPAPVNVTANTTYVASYHTTSGYYSVTRPYFTSQYANGSLVALADGVQGVNGVYRYNANNIFPSLGFQATNYWVDPIFHEN